DEDPVADVDRLDDIRLARRRRSTVRAEEGLPRHGHRVLHRDRPLLSLGRVRSYPLLPADRFLNEMQPASASRAGRLPRLLGAAAIPTLGVAIVAAMLATGGNPAVVLAPLVLLAVTFSVIRIPLRWSATGLVFLILSLEISTDAYGVWQSPLVHLGDLLGYGFSKVARVPVAGFEVAVVALVAVAAFRRASGATVDGTRATPAAPI